MIRSGKLSLWLTVYSSDQIYYNLNLIVTFEGILPYIVLFFINYYMNHLVIVSMKYECLIVCT